MATNVTFFEAISRWSDGDPNLRDSYLWGIKVLWWGRGGKLLAFLGGLVIIIDIIGPERLTGFNQRRASRLENSRNEAKFYIRSMMTILALIFVAVLAGGIVSMFNGEQTSPWTGFVGPAIADGDFGHPAILALIVATMLVACACIVRFWNYTLLPRVIRSLENNRTGSVARKISLTLFLLGFFFDMLAS